MTKQQKFAANSSSPVRHGFLVNMTNAGALILGMTLLAGCAHRYDMILTNQMRVTRISKPKLDRETGEYSFTDVSGKKKYVSAGQVVEILPHSSKDTTLGTKQ